MARKREVDVDQLLQSRPGRAARSQTRRGRRPRSRPAAPGCRCACCWPKPRRNQASTSCASVAGTTDVVPRAPLFDPAGRGMRVQVAHELRLAHRMPGELDPRVRAPALVQPRREQVAVLREDARRAVLLPQRTHLGRVIDLGREAAARPLGAAGAAPRAALRPARCAPRRTGRSSREHLAEPLRVGRALLRRGPAELGVPRVEPVAGEARKHVHVEVEDVLAGPGAVVLPGRDPVAVARVRRARPRCVSRSSTPPRARPPGSTRGRRNARSAPRSRALDCSPTSAARRTRSSARRARRRRSGGCARSPPRRGTDRRGTR